MRRFKADRAFFCLAEPGTGASLLSCSRSVANAWTNRTTLRTGDWVCCRCGFVSSSSVHRCSDCKAVRAHNCHLINQMACRSCRSLNHAENIHCFSCNKPLQFNDNKKGSGECRAAMRLQRPEDVRIVKKWSCAFCATANLHVRAVCIRCHHIRSR